MVTAIASAPSPTSYQVPKSDAIVEQVEDNAPMIGPSIVPMPPIITMKMPNALQFTVNAASGEMRRLPRK